MPADCEDLSPEVEYWGGLAYDAYFAHCQGKSIRGETLPPWNEQDVSIRLHWYAAAKHVRNVALGGE